jgi:hypothetical protein
MAHPPASAEARLLSSLSNASVWPWYISRSSSSITIHLTLFDFFLRDFYELFRDLRDGGSGFML